MDTIIAHMPLLASVLTTASAATDEDVKVNVWTTPTPAQPTAYCLQLEIGRGYGRKVARYVVWRDLDEHGWAELEKAVLADLVFGGIANNHDRLRRLLKSQ